jgi:hypothetical protein
VANSIAKANVLITADANGLHSTLASVGKDVHKLEGMGKGAGGGGAGGGGMLGMLGKMPPVAVAAGAAVAVFGLAVKESLDTLDDMRKQGDMASALGLTAEQFTGMAGVAKSFGEDTKEFVESLVTMGKLGSDAAAGVGEVAGPAFKALNIDAAEFVKMRADEQFWLMMKSIKAIEDPLTRTRTLMSAFGEDGGKLLLPMLSKSDEELRKMAKGFEISGESMKKAAAASDAVKNVKTAVGGMWREIVVAAAPAIEGVANFVGKVVEFVKPVGEWFGRMWQTEFKLFGLLWEEGGKVVSEVVTWIKETAGDMFGWTSELPTIQEVVVAVFRAIGISAALVWDTIKLGGGVIAVVAGEIVTGFGVVIDTLNEMMSVARAIPRSLRPPELDAFLDSSEAIAASAARTGKAMGDWGKKAVTGWGDSAFQFDAWLNKSLAKKPGEAAGAAATGAGGGPAITADPVKLGAAMVKGSKEAYSLEVRNRFGIEDKDKTAKKHLDATKGVKKATEKTAEGVKEVAAAIKDLKTI